MNTTIGRFHVSIDDWCVVVEHQNDEDKIIVLDKKEAIAMARLIIDIYDVEAP